MPRALLCARQCEACVRGMPPDEKGRPYNGEYCAACGQDCQSMVISQQNIAQQNSEIQDVLLSRSQERIIKTALDRVRAGSPLCSRSRAAPRQPAEGRAALLPQVAQIESFKRKQFSDQAEVQARMMSEHAQELEKLAKENSKLRQENKKLIGSSRCARPARPSAQPRR